MSLSRRDFLKASLSAGCFSVLPGISSLSYAAADNGLPLLVVLFLRGGADGLSLVAPSADPDYIAARPSDLRVLDEGGSSNILNQVLDKNAGFRFNANAASFPDLYRSKRLAVVHAVGILDATRSHFVAQEIIEKGISEEKMLARTDSGWLGRAIDNGGNGLVKGYSANASTDMSLYGSNAVFSAPDISTNFGLPYGQSTSDFLKTLSQNSKSPIQVATLNTLNILETVGRQQLRDANIQQIARPRKQPDKYEGSGELGRGLNAIAELAAMDAGLKVAALDHGGWDTHEGQAYRFTNQIKQLSAGLAAFDEDMQVRNKPYNIIVMTEFGRRLKSNKSGGTDHGHGACWLLLGDRVNGGQMYGKWPGLKNDALDHGVDLAVTTDYRTVLNESLIASGLNSAKSFPGMRAPNALHLFS